MSKKPSLFVVERKEVFILAILFVLSIVLTFTVGVKYGEIVGRKAAMEEITAEEGLKEASSNRGGTLGDEAGDGAGSKSESTTKLDAKHSSEAKEGSSPTEEGDEHTQAEAKETEADKGHDSLDTQASANAPSADSEESTGEVDGSVKDSDAELLEALKKAGIEKKSEGEAPDAEPEKTESIEVAEEASADFSGPHFVIQVGSYPTKRDAERHFTRLQSQNLDPRILPSVQTKNGRWFRVAVGQYESRGDAMEKARAFKRQGLIEDFFVRKVQ